MMQKVSVTIPHRHQRGGVHAMKGFHDTLLHMVFVVIAVVGFLCFCWSCKLPRGGNALRNVVCFIVALTRSRRRSTWFSFLVIVHSTRQPRNGMLVCDIIRLLHISKIDRLYIRPHLLCDRKCNRLMYTIFLIIIWFGTSQQARYVYQFMWQSGSFCFTKIKGS